MALKETSYKLWTFQVWLTTQILLTICSYTASFFHSGKTSSGKPRPNKAGLLPEKPLALLQPCLEP